MKQFLLEFKEELRYNIKDLKQELKFVEKQLEQKQNLLKNKRLDTIPLDTLENHVTTRNVATFARSLGLEHGHPMR